MELTDREMLEIAARACGYDTKHSWNAHRLTLDPPVIALCIPNVHSGWNPLEDDGQALRLANDKGISIIFTDCLDDAPIVIAKYCDGEVTRCNFPDHNKQTRRAIVEAVVKQQLLLEETCNGF